MSAYTYTIQSNSIDSDGGRSHQVSPAYLLSFVRWDNRDTVNFTDDLTKEVRKPLLVISDAISISISESKSSVTSSLNIILKGGDINYATAIAAGDFVTVNLVNSEKKQIELYNKASSLAPINGFDDGFKGVFKIQKVRRKISIEPNTGTKTVTYVVHAFSHTEINSVMYYDPIVSSAFGNENTIFIQQFDKFINQLLTSPSKPTNIQTIMYAFGKTLLGTGVKNGLLSIAPTQNQGFKIPADLASLLNVKGGTTAVDIQRFYYGVWNNIPEKSNSPQVGFLPPTDRFESNDTSFFRVLGKELQGYRILANESWNMVQIYSIIASFLNDTINEMYTCNRVGVDGFVYPTVIARQKPFSSESLSDSVIHTKYLSLPRWRITPDLVLDFDVGKDEIGRINFVQIYTSIPSFAITSEIQAAQVGLGNVFVDQEDIKRNGLRPFVRTVPFDFPNAPNNKKAREWAELLFDMLNAGQLRESGAMTCQGIEQPICVGDNLEFDGNVYHIEQVNHSLSIDGLGRKSFKTSLVLSFGTPVDSKKGNIKYAQMENTDAISELERDRNIEGMMAGISDTQDLPTRKDGEKTRKTPQENFNRENANQKRSKLITLKSLLKKDK